MKFRTPLIIFAAAIALHAAGLLTELPKDASLTAASFDAAFARIVKQNGWNKSTEPVAVDTIGNFDINGMPAYVLSMYSEEDFEEKAFYLVYEMNKKFHYHLLGSSHKEKKFFIESYNVTSHKRIYIQINFGEWIRDAEGIALSEHSRMFVLAFGSQGGKFLAYNVMVKSAVPGSAEKSSELSCVIRSDTEMEISPAGSLVDSTMMTLVGKHPIKY